MQKHDAFAALRYRDFSIVTINQFCLTLAILIQEIIVAYSLYQITKDPLTLGLIGLAEAIPFIAYRFGVVILLINLINRSS